MKRLRLLLLAVVLVAAVFVMVKTADAATYNVKPGDSLWRISRASGVPIATLQAANNMGGGTFLTVGQNFIVPEVYTVKSGDSLWQIGVNYKVSVQAVKSANGLTSNILFVGQVLYIPTGTSTTQEPKPVTSPGYTSAEMEMLARIIYAESRGEPYNGQVAVGAVVLNRVKHPNFPGTMQGVIFQKWAFSPVNDGSFWNVPNASAWQAARDAVNGFDPTAGALYFWNPFIVGPYNWVWTRTITYRIGNHVFAK